MTAAVSCERRDGIAEITLGEAGKPCGLTPQLQDNLLDRLEALKFDGEVRCITIAGASSNFMVGADLNALRRLADMTPPALRAELERQHRRSEPLWSMFRRMPQPVICSVRGFVAGGALGIVLGADLCVASETARFFLAQPRVGLSVDVGITYHLPRVVGLRRAKELALLGDQVDAARALDYGLVNWVVPDAELADRTRTVAGRIVASAAVALRETKWLLDQGVENGLDDHLALESVALGRSAGSPDFMEGVTAFLDKRKPRFGA